MSSLNKLLIENANKGDLNEVKNLIENALIFMLAMKTHLDGVLIADI